MTVVRTKSFGMSDAGVPALQLLLRPVDRDRPGQVVHLGDVADGRLGARVVDRASHLGAVVLGREAEALEAGAVLARLAEIGVQLDHADRLPLVDKVGVGHPAELVVAPPEGLVLAPMPAQQLGQQPGRPLFVGRRRGGEVDALEIAGQRGHHLGDLGSAPLGLGRLDGLGLQGRARDLQPSRSPRSSRRASSQSRRRHVLTTSSRL